MAENIGALYPTKIPGLADAADIQEAFRLYHYGAPSGTDPGEYDPSNTNPASLPQDSVAYHLRFLQTQITTISGSLGVQASNWSAKGALVSATGPSAITTVTIPSDRLNGAVLTTNAGQSSGLSWEFPSVTPTSTTTFTGKNIDLTNNALTGTIAQFNTALSDADFATLAGSETLLNKTLTLPKITSDSAIADSNGNELIKFPPTISLAVNQITVSNSATGVAPSIAASGDDTNIGLNLVSKGTGTVQVNGVEIATISGTQILSGKSINIGSTGSNLNTISGTLPIANGGTGAATVENARIALGTILYSATSAQGTASSNRIFVQSTQPTGAVAGDLWFW